MKIHFAKYNENPDQIGYTIFNGEIIYAPRNAIRVFVREEAEKHLRSKYNPGKYKGKEKCNSILKHLFEYYHSKIDSLIPLIASKDWLAFILFQYEQSAKINKRYKGDKLSNQESEYWKIEGPVFRQTIDYLCEKFVQFYNQNENYLPNNEQALIFDLIWINTKLAIDFTNVSNLTHMVIPNDTEIEILPKGNEIFIDHNVIKSSGFEDCFQEL